VARCTNCRGKLDNDRERVGARCPHCCQPLYEEPRDPHRPPLYGASAARCLVHAGNPAVGPCQRCGNFMCSVCRTRWRNQGVCLACIERALESRESAPAEARAHFRQALLAVLFGLVAWLIVLAASGLLFAGAGEGPGSKGLLALAVLLLLFSPLPSILGVGQGAAAIRVRGDHMILATIGLVLSGLNTGVVLGLFIAGILARNG